MANSDLMEMLNALAVEVRQTGLAADTRPTPTEGVLFANLMRWTVVSLLKPQWLGPGTYTAGRKDKLTALQAKVGALDGSYSEPPLFPTNGYVDLPTSPRPICYLEININTYPATEVSWREFQQIKTDVLAVPTVTKPVYAFDQGKLYYYPYYVVNTPANVIYFKYLALAADMVVTGIVATEALPEAHDLMEAVIEGMKALTHAQALNDQKMQDHLQRFFEKALGKDPRKIEGLVGVAQQLIPAVRT